MKPLFKTTIVIWPQFNPSDLDIDSLAQEAIDGDAYCSSKETLYVEHPDSDPVWDGTSFFDEP